MGSLKRILPGIIIGMSAIIICFGCAVTPQYATVTPELRMQFMQDLKAGNRSLTCDSLGCDLAWVRQLNMMVSLHNSGQWEKLAEEVMRIGLQRDLPYYFLGRSAEGLGYSDAALKYYQYSAALYQDSNALHHCRDSKDARGCRGFDLASVLPQRIAMLEKAKNAQSMSQAYIPNNNNSTNDSGGKHRGGAAKPPPSVENRQGWSSLGTELDGGCYALAVAPDGTLYAGGAFTMAGGVKANHIAKWDGSKWSPLGGGIDSDVSSLALAPNGILYAVWGNMSTGSPTKEGPCNISKWDGSTWSSLGTKFSGSLGGPFAPIIRTILAAPDGTLYAAGEFKNAGGIPARSIAKWDGSRWSPLGAGLDRECNSLAIASDGTLYAGGDIIKAGKKKTNLIAKWNGSAWSSLGTGLDGYKASVSDLKIGPDGMLYVAGRFTGAGGQDAGGFAKWNGSRWFGLAGPHTDFLDGPLAVATNGKVYAVGAYPGSGAAEDGILSWDGSKWYVVYRTTYQGKREKKDESVTALIIDPNNTIYAAASYKNENGKDVNYIAKWNASKAGRIPTIEEVRSSRGN